MLTARLRLYLETRDAGVRDAKRRDTFCLQIEISRISEHYPVLLFYSGYNVQCRNLCSSETHDHLIFERPEKPLFAERSHFPPPRTRRVDVYDEILSKASACRSIIVEHSKTHSKIAILIVIGDRCLSLTP